jgi:hypothetical protein
MLGKDAIKRMKIIVTDGDSQEISQLDDVIARLSPMPIRSGAPGQIIDRKWHKRLMWLLVASHARKGLPTA